MAGFALTRGGLVEQDFFAIQFAGQLMTGLAPHISMYTLEGEIGAVVVVKQRRLPLRTVVAVGAGCHSSRIRELPAVNFFVAILTLNGGRLEVRLGQPGTQICRLVAIDAGGGPVSADQLERGGRVIEL